MNFLAVLPLRAGLWLSESPDNVDNLENQNNGILAMFLLAYELGIDWNVRYLLSCVQLLLIEILGFHDECPHLVQADGRGGAVYFHQDGINVVQVKRGEIPFHSANEFLWLTTCFLRAGQPLQKWGK